MAIRSENNHHHTRTIQGTEIFIPFLIKESGDKPFIIEGSIDVLSASVIETLRNNKDHGLFQRLTTWESRCTSGNLGSAITREGCTDFFSRGFITTDRRSVASLDQFREMNLIYDSFGQNTKEVALASAVLLNNTRQEEISLVTTGDILSEGSNAHIAIKIKGEDRPDLLTVSHEYFINAMKYYGIDTKNASLNSLKKQFVTHQSLLFLMHKIRGIKEHIPFVPRVQNETLFKYNAQLMKKIDAKFQELELSLGLAESAPGGLLADKISDFSDGNYLHRGDIVYNEEAKREIGVSDFALDQLNVYSDIAATESARCVNLKKDVDVAIGAIARLNTPDTRTESATVGDLYYSLQVKGKREHKKEKPYLLPTRSRLEMKEMCALIVFRHLLRVLSEK